MRISDAFPSNYLKAADLQGRMVTVTVAGSRMEDFGGEEKPCLLFQGKDKGMVLNKTNASAIVSAYGDETDEWIGKPIELYSARVMFQGSMVDGLRVRVPAPPSPQPAPYVAPSPPRDLHAPVSPLGGAAESFDDDIPF